MKRIYTLCGIYLLALVMVTGISVERNNFRKEKSHKVEDGSGPDNPLALEQYLHDRYADPLTGEIPMGNLYKAYQQLMARGLIKSGLKMQKVNSNSNVWQLVNDFFPSLCITKITSDPNHPNVFYFCTGEGWLNLDEQPGAGIFKSTDAGTTWNQLAVTDTTNFKFCEDMKVHPKTSDIYVATYYGGLQRSQDGGLTWKKVLGAPPYQATANAMCNIAFTKNGGIFCTVGDFVPGAIYYSDSGDSGTWVRQTNGFPLNGIYRVAIATAPSNDSVAYAITCNNTNYEIQGFYKTTDKGAHWDTISKPGNNTLFAKKQAWYDLVIAVDPNNDSTVSAGGWELWRTKNGGKSWLQFGDGQPDSNAGQYIHVDQHEIVFVNSDTVLFSCDGGIWESDDFTDSFPKVFSRNYGYRVTQFYEADLNPIAGNPFVFGGTQDNGSPAMPFSGLSNFFDLSWADGGYCAINYNNPGTIFTTKNSNGVYRINNYNYSTRDTITNPYLTDNSVLFINPLVMDPNNPDILYMASTDGLWRLKNASTAKDSDWTQASKPVLNNISAIGISKSSPNTVFFGRSAGGHIYRIDHADTTGKTYTPINCDPNNNMPTGSGFSPVFCSSVFVDPKDVNHVFAVYSNSGIYNIWETHNSMSSSQIWKRQDGDLPNIPVNDVFLNPGDSEICYAATDLGVFYTIKLNGDSTHWLPSNQGLANVRVEMFKYRASDNTIIAATHGRGIFQSTVNTSKSGSYELIWTERGPNNVGGRTRTIMIDPNVTSHHKIWAAGVSGGLWFVNNIDSLPVTSGVSTPVTQQNFFKAYPNPFENVVYFSFNVGDNNSNSVLRIYDISGKIVEEINCKGQNQFTWYPSAGMASGIYFAELISGGNKYVQKIVSLR